MTKIEWTHRPGTTGVTWNPVTGCTKISEGCIHCYAERMAKRLDGRHGYPKAPHQFDVTLHPDKLDQPLHWKKPRTVFVCSMGDLFHQDAERKWIVTVFAIMALAQRHTFIILTKRAERMRELLADKVFWQDVEATAIIYALRQGVDLPSENFTEIRNIKVPLFNVWGLVTAENQKQIDARVPILLQCPFVVRGVSIEPMLGPMDLGESLCGYPRQTSARSLVSHEMAMDAECPEMEGTLWTDDAWEQTMPALDWVILGPETGPSAREMPLDGARQVRDQCVAADVPFFFKRGLLDGQEWRQWPQ